MKKIILIILVFLFTLSYLNVDAADKVICVGSEMCSSYDLDCNRFGDGYCPENYGNWDECSQQTYYDSTTDLGKCYPCDPDCGFCGAIEILAPPYVNPPCKDIGVTVTARLTKTPDTIRLKEGKDLAGPEIVPEGNFQCKSGEQTCQHTFIYNPKSCQPGGELYVTATTTNLQPSTFQTQKIEINPLVDLEIPVDNVNVRLVNSKLEAKNIIQLNVDVRSERGVAQAKAYLYKKDLKTNKFRPVNANARGSDFCSFRCDTVKDPNCNLLFSQDASILETNEHIFKFGWDGTRCDNKEFLVTAYGYDLAGKSNTDSETLTLNNENPPCIDECYLFNSPLLNTVYLKVRSWIT